MERHLNLQRAIKGIGQHAYILDQEAEVGEQAGEPDVPEHRYAAALPTKVPGGPVFRPLSAVTQDG